MILALLFLIASFLTIICSWKLAKYADGISENSDMGGTLVGILLLSAATSLPELMSSGSASFLGNVDLAFGNVFGSNMTNLFILVLLDASIRDPIFLRISPRNLMSGGIVVFLTSIVLLMMLISKASFFEGMNLWFFSVLIGLFYFLGMRKIYVFETNANLEERAISEQQNKENSEKDRRKLKRSIWGFCIFAIFVLFSAFLLSYVSDKISQIPVGGKSLGGTFVGTLLMAFVTSLPEIVVSLTLLRMNSVDIALGNILGSNLFNLVILSVTSASFRLGEWFRMGALGSFDSFHLASQNHLLSGLLSMVFMGILFYEVLFRRNRKYAWLGAGTWWIGVFYILGFYLLFILR